MNECYCTECLPVLHIRQGRTGDRKERSEQVHVSLLKRIEFCWRIVEMLYTVGKLLWFRQSICRETSGCACVGASVCVLCAL